MVFSKSLLAAATLPALALAAVHDVDVGNGGLKFTPDNIKADKGDTVNFHFYPSDHSVAQSTFDKPCVPSGDDAIYSNFISPTSGVDSMMFQIVVNSTDPLWLYCSSSEDHCQSGMAMVINAPANATIDMYKSAAASVSTVVSPSTVHGGVVIANQNGESASTASSSASKSSASASSASSSASKSSASAASTSSKAAASSSSASMASATSSMAESSSAASSAAAATSSASKNNAATRAPDAFMAAVAALFACTLL